MSRFFIPTVVLSLLVASLAFADAKKDAKEHIKKADDLYAEGRYELAVMEYEKAHSINSNFKILFKIAITEAKLENHSRAIKKYEQYLEEGGKKAQRRSKAQREIKKLKALIDEKESTEKKKTQALKHFKAGGDLYKTKEYKQALIEYNKAYDLDPDWVILYSFGKTQAKLGMRKDAIASYERYLISGGKKIDAKRRVMVEEKISKLEIEAKEMAAKSEALEAFNLGKEFFENQQYARALDKFKAARDMKLGYEVNHNIAQTYLKTDEVDLAIKAFNRYLKEGGKKIGVADTKEIKSQIASLKKEKIEAASAQKSAKLLKKGIELYDKGKYKPAGKELEKAYNLSPGWESTYYRAKVEEKLGNRDKAISWYEQCIKKDDLPANQKDTVVALLEKLNEQIATEAKAATNDKKADSLIASANAASKAADWKTALGFFEDAYALAERSALLYDIGSCQAKLEKNSAALKTFSNYLEKDKKVSKKRRAKVNKEIARLEAIVKKTQDKEKAQEYYNKAKSMKKIGSWKEAAEYYEKAYDLWPMYKILSYLGYCQAKAKQYKPAAKSYARYLIEAKDLIDDTKKEKTRKEIDRLRAKAKEVDDQKSSRKHFKLGKEAAANNQWNKASSEFEAAYVAWPDHEILYHMGKAALKINLQAKALFAYYRYLPKAGSDLAEDERKVIKDTIKELYKKVGVVELECPVRGSIIKLDGMVVGTAPMIDPIFIEPGQTHELKVLNGEKELYKKTVKMKAGERKTLQVTVSSLAK